MAEQAAARTEPPTPRRLRDARRKGQVAASRDLTSAAAFAAGLAALAATLPATAVSLGRFVAGAAARAFEPDRLDAAAALGALEGAAIEAASASALVACAALAAAALAGALQAGGVVAVGAAAPKLERLDPFGGLRRLFALRTAVELGKTWLKVACAAGAAVSVVASHHADLAAFAASDPPEALAGAAAIAAGAAARVALVLLLLAAADVLVQRRLHERDLRMTKDEVRRDHREDEGDPHVKSARRQAHREIAAERMVAAAREASFVAVNPTRLAVALRYDGDSDAAPRVVAKGTGRLALRIRRAAEGAGVRVVRDRPLARALYLVPVEAEIPEALYTAVAEVLAWIESRE